MPRWRTFMTALGFLGILLACPLAIAARRMSQPTATLTAPATPTPTTMALSPTLTMVVPAVVSTPTPPPTPTPSPPTPTPTPTALPRLVVVPAAQSLACIRQSAAWHKVRVREWFILNPYGHIALNPDPKSQDIVGHPLAGLAYRDLQYPVLVDSIQTAMDRADIYNPGRTWTFAGFYLLEAEDGAPLPPLAVFFFDQQGRTLGLLPEVARMYEEATGHPLPLESAPCVTEWTQP